MAEILRCPQCNQDVSADAPEGLCPECLFRQAMEGPVSPLQGDEEGRSPQRTFIPPTPGELASHFPQLEMLALVGQGGMGAVYKARQTKLDRLVALKILPPEIARAPAFAERFTREARSLARLNHSNITTIFDFGEVDGLYYFSMEFVEGKNARELLQAGALNPAEAIKIVTQVCDALQYAHDEGLVHRDIKPENILLDKKGRVKIADFGLAKLVGLTPAYLTLTGTHEVMGTLYYMAPEQMGRSHQVDHRADLYSLGVVMYEMLTGELPVGRFAPPSQKARMDARLDAIVLRALAREPEQRYQDAGELKRDIEALAAAGPAVRQEHGTPTPAAAYAARPSWPSVSFTIPDTSAWGAHARGEILRDEEALILQFEKISAWGVPAGKMKEVRIPFDAIASLTCQGSLVNTELVIKTFRFSTLADLPANAAGRGRLSIPRAERDAARRLVDSVVRRLPPGAEVDPPAPGAQPGGQEVNLDRTAMDVAWPAVGLLLTGIASLISCLGFIAGSIAVESQYRPGPREEGAVIGLALMGIVQGLLGIFIMYASLRMMRLRSYNLNLTAAMLALVPWSPAWLIGLPAGIVALVILRRSEVMAAFLSNRPGARPTTAAEIAPRPVLRGRFFSFWRSFGGYFLPTMAGRNRADQDIPGDVDANLVPGKGNGETIVRRGDKPEAGTAGE